MRRRAPSVNPILTTSSPTPSAAFGQLCDLFDVHTQNGGEMAHENHLLVRAIEFIKATFARRSSVRLLSGRGGLLPTAGETPAPPNDLELITWLAVMDGSKD